MKFTAFYIFLCLFLSNTYAQEIEPNNELNIFDGKEFLDNENQVIVNINSLDLEKIIVQEKDYLVSSERLKALHSKENNFPKSVQYKVDFSQSIANPNWIKILKVLINDKNLLKIEEVNTNEPISYLYVSENFDLAYYELLASKTNCAINFIHLENQNHE